MLLAALSAYAWICLSLAPKRAVKREKAAWALLCGYAGMFLMSRAAYSLMDKNAVTNLASAGEISFFGFVGFFAGVRLYCLKSPKAFRKLLGLFASPFFALAAALYLLRDGAAGIPAPRGGLFRYTDVYGLSRWNAPLIQGTLILLLMAAAFAMQHFTALPEKEPSGKASKRFQFKIRFLPMTLASLSLVLPQELLRDTTQRRIAGIPCETLAIWLCLMALLAVYLLRKLSGMTMPLRSKLINALLAGVFPLIAFFTLGGKSALLSLILTALPVFLTLSPLFPFVKRPNRAFARRRRRFS